MKLLEATRSSPSWGIAIDIKCAKDITLYVLRCILQLLHHTTHFRVDALYYIHEVQCYRLHAQQNLSRTRLEAYAVPTLISYCLGLAVAITAHSRAKGDTRLKSNPPCFSGSRATIEALLSKTQPSKPSLSQSQMGLSSSAAQYGVCLSWNNT